MKLSFITTVLNEEETIEQFLNSIFTQSNQPNEIVIVDGGSKDKTVSEIQKFKIKNQNDRLRFKVFIKKGNRSVGRNEAIKNATGDIIVCSDAGCILHSQFIENITRPFANNDAEVSAGYYDIKAESMFQRCLAPFVLVMRDKVDPHIFLPSARSCAFRKYVWEKVGGYPEEFSHNEDYVFARRVKKSGFEMVFVPDAVVYWIPRKNLREAFSMFYRFAKGDIEARIIRPKVVLLFLRYFLFLFLVSYIIMTKLSFTTYLVLFLFYIYILWSILKNYGYVRHWKAFIYLPLLQFTADVAVMMGSIKGLVDGRE